MSYPDLGVRAEGLVRVFFLVFCCMMHRRIVFRYIHTYSYSDYHVNKTIWNTNKHTLNSVLTDTHTDSQSVSQTDKQNNILPVSVDSHIAHCLMHS